MKAVVRSLDTIQSAKGSEANKENLFVEWHNLSGIIKKTSQAVIVRAQG
jgi:hypothetical protein